MSEFDWITEHKPTTDDAYVELYDKIGHEHFGKGSDEQLAEWGHDEETIRCIKIDSVKFELDWHSKGIDMYKKLNKILGGVNLL